MKYYIISAAINLGILLIPIATPVLKQKLEEKKEKQTIVVDLKNSILEELINNCLGFFKLVFIVSNFRGHNAVFHLKNENNDREEKDEVKIFLETVYEIEKKVLEIIGGR